MRKTVLLLASMTLAVLLAAGVALAATIQCPNRGENRCVGTAQNDTMTGTQRPDDMRGRRGNDSINARGGNDKLAGNDGGDTLRGGGGNDTYLFANGWGYDQIPGAGESGGSDTLNFTAVSHDITLRFERGRFSPGPSARNGLDFSSARIETFLSGEGEDKIFGDNASNTISGGSGDDEIYGAFHEVTEGNDHLLGNLGQDELEGGGGNDTLEGGKDPDEYLYGSFLLGHDTIVDSVEDDGGPPSFSGNDNTLVFGPPDYEGDFDEAVRVDLASSPERPEVVNESGEGRVNWSGNAITDVFMQSELNDDTVKGNALNNTILMYSGSDTVYGRAGDDVINVGDSNADDVVDCGEDGPGIADNDRVHADLGDTLINCETVTVQ
jgi:Ca2+-binding RTX toxin-like protein